MMTGCAKERNERQEMLRPLDKDTLLSPWALLPAPLSLQGHRGVALGAAPAEPRCPKQAGRRNRSGASGMGTGSC